MSINNPSIIQCVHMVERLVASGYTLPKAISAVANAYGIPVSDLTILVGE